VIELLLVLVALLGAALLIVAVAALRTVARLRKELAGLEGSVAALRADLDRQSERLNALAAALDQRRNDPAFLVAESLNGLRRRGVVGTALLLGVRLFRSYLGSRPRRKALPPPSRPE
jgi:hypothetical protein